LDIPYGPHAAETLDFFPAGSNAPLFIFIHGGYWRLLSKNESSFCAHAFVQAGIAFAAVNYSLAPAANLDTIVHQVRQCVAFLWQSAGEYATERPLARRIGIASRCYCRGRVCQWSF
jgi:arylformamidase